MSNIFRVTITVTGDEREALNQRIRENTTTGDGGSRVDLGCDAIMWLSTRHGDSIVIEADKTVIDGETHDWPPLNSLMEVSIDFPKLKFELFSWDLSNDHYDVWRMQDGTGQLWESANLDYYTGDGTGTVYFVRDGEPCASDEAIRENHWWDRPFSPPDQDRDPSASEELSAEILSMNDEDIEFLDFLTGVRAEKPQNELSGDI